jgi:hypothetical protein
MAELMEIDALVKKARSAGETVRSD